MSFSTPFTSRKSKRSSAVYPPGFRNGSSLDLDRRLTHINDTRKSTHDPIMDLNFGFGPSRRSSTSTQSLESVQQFLGDLDTSSSSNNNRDTLCAPYSPSLQPSIPARYYNHALSNEDSTALAYGELNHNLQVWAPEDMVKYHESRKSLVPSGAGVSKLRKMEAFATIEEEKKHSQRALDKRVRGKALLPSFRLTNDRGQQEYISYHPQASQSMYDLRSTSTIAPQLTRDAPSSPPPAPELRRKYSWEADEAPSTPGQNFGTAGGIDSGYFSSQPGPEVLSTPTSRTSSRVSSSRLSSPLSNKNTAHQHNPDMTFDAFLAPHESGKGEAYRGANNAKKAKAKSKPRDSEDFDMSVPGPAKEKTLRRFTKMRSRPNLRQRFSRSGLKQEGEEGDVPDVPALS